MTTTTFNFIFDSYYYAESNSNANNFNLARAKFGAGDSVFQSSTFPNTLQGTINGSVLVSLNRYKYHLSTASLSGEYISDVRFYVKGRSGADGDVWDLTDVGTNPLLFTQGFSNFGGSSNEYPDWTDVGIASAFKDYIKKTGNTDIMLVAHNDYNNNATNQGYYFHGYTNGIGFKIEVDHEPIIPTKGNQMIIGG